MPVDQTLAVAFSVGCFAAFPIAAVIAVWRLQREEHRREHDEPGSHGEHHQDAGAEQ